jgi:hypothetical protein
MDDMEIVALHNEKVAEAARVKDSLTQEPAFPLKLEDRYPMFQLEFRRQQKSQTSTMEQPRKRSTSRKGKCRRR